MVFSSCRSSGSCLTSRRYVSTRGVGFVQSAAPTGCPYATLVTDSISFSFVCPQTSTALKLLNQLMTHTNELEEAQDQDAQDLALAKIVRHLVCSCGWW